MITAATMEQLQAYRAWADLLPSVEAAAAEYAADEDTLRNDLVESIAADLWRQDHEDGPSLLAEIRYYTSGRMLRPSAPDVATDWRESIPAHYRRMRNGVPADTVCSELGFDSEVALMDAIKAEVGTRIHSHAQAVAMAEDIAKHAPELVDLQTDHAASLQNLAEEWTRIRAKLAELTAELQAEIAEDPQPVAVAVVAAPVPSRRARFARTPMATTAARWVVGTMADTWTAAQFGARLLLAMLWHVEADCGQHVSRRTARAHCTHCQYLRADLAAARVTDLTTAYRAAWVEAMTPAPWDRITIHQ